MTAMPTPCPETKTALEALELWTLTYCQEERKLLIRGAYVERIPSGGRIFGEGEEVTCLCYLYRGQAMMSRSGVSGRSHITRLIRAGQFFGIRPFFAGSPARSTATALGEVMVLRLCIRSIDELLERNSRICRYFLTLLAVKLERDEERMITLTQKHIRGRLADTLLLLARHYGYEADGTTLAISLSRSDLGTLSNMTTSNVIRTLSLFASERIIALEGRRIRIIDASALERVSRLG